MVTPTELVTGTTGELKVAPPTNCPHHCKVIPVFAEADKAVAISPTLYIWLLPVIFTGGIIALIVNVKEAPDAL